MKYIQETAEAWKGSVQDTKALFFLSVLIFTPFLLRLLPFQDVSGYIRWTIAFVIIGFFFWQKHADLPLYNIDKPTFTLFIASLLLMIIAEPTQSFIILLLAAPTHSFIVLRCTLFLMALFVIFKYRWPLYKTFRKLPPLSKRSIYWILIGLVTGIILAFALSLPPALGALIFPQEITDNMYSVKRVIGLSFVGNLITVALVEEIAFRGLLWGYLANLGWPLRRILEVQAFLFWLLHIPLILQPYSFFIIIPTVAIVFGVLTLKSRSVTSSIVAHATYNSLYLIMPELIGSIFR